MKLFPGIACVVALCFAGQASAAALNDKQMRDLLARVDDMFRWPSDYTMVAYIEQKNRDAPSLVYEVAVYRRDKTDTMSVVFTKPRTEVGKGYLRAEKNLWLYDPKVGKWDRRTNRDKLAASSASTSDFDAWHLVEEYDPQFVGEEKVDKFDTFVLKLTAKPGIDAEPVRYMWFDQKSNLPIKMRVETANGKPKRTQLWTKYASKEDRGKKVMYMTECRVIDEVEKGNSALVIVQNIDLSPVSDNIFTKAWFESKSR